MGSWKIEGSLTEGVLRMFDNEKMEKLKAKMLSNTEIEEMTAADLRTMRARIDAHLPETSMSNINLEKELLEQFQAVKDLQSSVLDDPETPANQKAQVANAVAATLNQLIKMQSEYYTSERFKAIEALMVKFMKKLPKDMVDEFLTEYETIE